MFRKTLLTVCLMGCCVWCLALASSAEGDEPAGAVSAYKPVASVGALMHGQKTFFKQIRGALADPLMEERAALIGAAAEVLAELANLNAQKSEKSDYRGWASALRDTGLKLASEARKGVQADETKMGQLAQQMGQTCGACHDAYQ